MHRLNTAEVRRPIPPIPPIPQAPQMTSSVAMDVAVGQETECRTEPDVLRPLATVATLHGLDPLAARLLELRAWLADDLQGLDVALSEVERQLGEDKVARAAQHLLARPGKRIRPLCVLLGARLGGRGLDDTVRPLAVACELVHAATLLHDDVIDDSTERRGSPASRMLYGNAASILAGDHLLIEALRLVQGARLPELLVGLLDVISEMVSAEALQLERRGRFDPSRAIYLQVINGKTASLFRFGLRAGGVAAGLPQPELARLGRIGLSLGTAFQLVDDVLDLAGDASTTGKNALADVREGKLTWPLLLAAEQDATLVSELRALAEGPVGNLSSERTARLVERIKATTALTQTRDFALSMAARALDDVMALPVGRPRDALAAVVESAVHRVR